MKQTDFPALFQSADKSSNGAQSSYLWLIRLQYFLLLLAAIATTFPQQTEVLIIYAVLVGASTILLISMAVIKPEKDWYACRALAESIKTETWRFMMRAEPFEDCQKVSEAKAKFAHLLDQLLRSNKHVGEAISKNPIKGDQISQYMTEMRSKGLPERIKAYRTLRIDNQQSWYVDKTKANKKYFRIWFFACLIVQAAAIILAVVRIAYPTLINLWPIEPLLLLASAIIGWIQIKKFNELASAYSLTAHEIGIIQTRVDDVTTDDEFSNFVNESERAFSREHTQWIARQTE